MNFSLFGEKLARNSGIYELMDDLGNALAGKADMLMLGGGNPAHIPAVEEYLRKRMRTLLRTRTAFGRVVGNYDTPQGNTEFIKSLASLLRNQYGWKIGPENIAITNGSQTSFFILFNIFAGKFRNGSTKRIMLPLTPEYIGYSDVGLTKDFFATSKPEIELLDNHIFKYHINFDSVKVTKDIGAICVSRPTNPTGNVLTDEEVRKLCALARAYKIPLIIDNAYGTPFPHIIFVDATPVWDEHVILCMSLSKLGLPATRTGIVIASPEIIHAISATNAIISLAPGGLGAVLALELVKTGKIIKMSHTIIKPYYQQKVNSAIAQLHHELRGLDYRIHKPEGALFLWLWLKDLPVTSAELYSRLKKRGVLVVPGHYFFPGLKNDWRHKYECIRITYSQDSKVVTKGLRIIGDEIRKIYMSA